MHNMLLDSTLPFHSGPGAEGRQTRAASSLASVFHASGAEAWQSLPWLYLGQTIRVFWCKMNAPECFCMEGEMCRPWGTSSPASTRCRGPAALWGQL